MLPLDSGLPVYFKSLVLPVFCGLRVVQLSAPCAFPRCLPTTASVLPQIRLLGCLLRLTFCTPKASTAICPASLWMPHTATWLCLRVLANHVWAGNWTLTVTCPLPVLTVSFCLVHYLNPPHGQHYTCWNTLPSSPVQSQALCPSTSNWGLRPAIG